jgi:hypothetical protein
VIGDPPIDDFSKKLAICRLRIIPIVWHEVSAATRDGSAFQVAGAKL